MNGEGSKEPENVDDEVGTDPDETVVLTEVDDGDELSETVAGLNVDELVAKMETSDADSLAKKRELRRRLEEKQEQLQEDDEFGSTYAFDLDDDLTT